MVETTELFEMIIIKGDSILIHGTTTLVTFIDALADGGIVRPGRGIVHIVSSSLDAQRDLPCTKYRRKTTARV